ncbi:MAG: ribosome-associated translation inhibitor RaiA [Nocardioides alkalitolerans]
MEIVVTGRHVEVSEGFRSHVEEKLARLEKHDHRIIRVQVEVSEEKNPRQADRCMKVQLTAFSKGPVVRAEACADHKMGALDVALDRMAAQMRRAADRRRIHRGRHVPTSVAQALAGTGVVEERAADDLGDAPADGAPQRRQVGGIEVEGDGPLVVREKVHPAEPMTLDQALYEMELVGHDFYLFVDKANDRPSVVYRRRGYDYGVIALDLDGALEGVDGEVAGAGAGVLAGRAEA